MGRPPIAVTALPAAALLAAGLFALPARAEDASVQATAQNTFQPGTVTVNVGDTVTWTSAGGVNHTVTSSSGNWDHDASLPVPTRSTQFTFEAPGTYTYYCRTHGTPSSGMRGAVVVRSAASPTRSPSRTPTPRPTTPRPTTPAPTVPPLPTATTSESPDPTPSPDGPPAATTPPPGSPPASPGRPLSPTPVDAGSEPEPSPTPGTIALRDDGPGLPDPTGRGRGLPIVLALVAIGGVVSAQVRALLAEPLDR